MKVCKDCIDFNNILNECLIRYTIKNKIKVPMKRKPNQKACSVFLNKN